MPNLASIASRAPTLVLALGFLVVGCQVVFGDYEIDPKMIAAGAAGTTLASDCTPGQRICNDAELRKCQADKTWKTLDTCHSALHCVDTQDSCLKCIANEAKCVNDGTIQKCNVAQDAWLPEQACPPAQPICTATVDGSSSSECVACVHNECKDNSTLRQCLPNRQQYRDLTCTSDDKLCHVSLDGAEANCGRCLMTGNFCSGRYTIRTCIGGDSTIMQECAAGTECVLVDDAAVCQPISQQ